MFFAAAIGSMLGYVLQNLLLIRYARKIDSLSLAFYRNISFVVTFLPLLIGSSPEEIGEVLSRWPLLLASGITGALSLALALAAYKHIAISVVSTVNKVMLTIILTIIAWIAFGESLTIPGLLFITLATLGSMILGLRQQTFSHLDNRFARGIGLALLGSLFLSMTHLGFITLSRRTNPLVSGYAWEVAIAAACLLFIVLRQFLIKRSLQRVSLRTFLLIALCSAPTLIGTGLYAIALRLGPVAYIKTIGNTALVVTALLSWWLYGEKLKWEQWVCIGVVLGALIGLALL